jgi:hypothetical protein
MRVHSIRAAIAAIIVPMASTGLAQQAYLKGTSVGAYHEFGSSIAMSGDTLIVGELAFTDFSSSYGAAHVFQRNGATWSHQAILSQSSSQSWGYFGYAVAISADTAVVGTLEGVKVFVRTGATWSEQAHLTSSNGEPGDGFGLSLGISGDTIVVGARSERSSASGVNGNQADNGAPGAGAAYVFVRNGTTWSQQSYLKASNAAKGARFGASVGISGDTLVVGATGGFFSPSTPVNPGAAYVFTRNGASWAEQAYLPDPNAQNYDAFGLSVAISDETVVVGSLASAAYVFRRNGMTWSQHAVLSVPNGPATGFGFRVGVHGNSVIVGAPFDASSATGVNGNPLDNSAPESGAAYLFVRNGTTWTQEAYLKASNTEAGDKFGSAIAITGSELVVAAPFEDSGATGINGNQNDNSVNSAGAVYAFEAPCGGVSPYAEGCPGSGGVVPTLDASGCAAVGDSLVVNVRNGVPFAPGVLILGTSRASIPIGFGCSAVVAPLPLTGLALAGLSANGDLAFGGTLAPHVAGTMTTMQVLLLDAGAPGGFSASNGLEVIVP